MRIQYYMQFFPGEAAVGTQQPFTFARVLAERGNDVTVISADYNLDTGLPELALDRQVSRGRIRIFRLPCPRGGRGSNRDRLWSYGHFMASAFRSGRRAPRPDVVVGSIQPMFTGLAAWQVARHAHVPFVLEVRDLWPDALVVKGAMRRWQAAPLYLMESALYRAADRIVSLTPGIKTEILRKGIPDSKVEVYPNGFNPSLFATESGTREDVRARRGWGDERVLIYAGSFTKVTAVDVFVRAAALVQDCPGLRLELFGNGPTRDQVRSLAERLGTRNVYFREPVPKREVPGLLAAADAGLMSLFPTPLAHIYFENKFIDYMGAGLPILGAMDGEQARILHQFGAGEVVGPGDVQGLAKLFRAAFECPAQLSVMGRAGKDLVWDTLLLPAILERYAEMVEAAGKGDLPARPVWEPRLDLQH